MAKQRATGRGKGGAKAAWDRPRTLWAIQYVRGLKPVFVEDEYVAVAAKEAGHKVSEGAWVPARRKGRVAR